MKKNIIDISWPISEDMTSYKDQKPVGLKKTKDFTHGDGVRDANLVFNTHTGTHIDAPAHFLEHGCTVDQVPLASLIGPCRVVDATTVKQAIDTSFLSSCGIQADDIILFKTTNSVLPATGPFKRDFVYLEKSGAQFLVDRGVKAVGIDYLGIERNQPEHETHKVLLGKKIPIIEGLRLAHVAAGGYQLYCLPLALQGLEAAPARAILLPL